MADEKPPLSPEATTESLCLNTFTAAVAKVFQGKKTTQLSKLEMFDDICKNLNGCTASVFEAQLNKLDSLNKIAIIDEMCFSLC